MKKIRLLLIINIIQVVLLVASVGASVIVLPQIMHFGENDVPMTVVLGTDDDKYNGYAQVTAYGAVADDGKDDTEAFKKAIATNASVYVPIGTFEINETLIIESKTLKGSGSSKTVIRSSADKTAVSLSGNAVVEDISFCFADGVVSGSETSGEKVALLDNGLTSGSMIRGVTFNNVGTGFLSGLDKGAFCTTIEAVRFENFAFKAIEIKNGMSSVIRSATVGKALNSASVPVSVGGVVTFEAIGFNGTECNYALELKDATSVFIRNISFKDVKASENGLISCDSARFTTQTATLLNTECKNLVTVNDSDDSYASMGVVNMVYADIGEYVSVSESDKIQNEINLK